MISVRGASIFDIPAVYQLERQVFPFDAYPYLDLSLLFLIPNMVNLKAVNIANDLIGYVCGARAWLPFRPGWIVTLAVASDYQRQGIGQQLLAECETRLASSRVRLTVRKTNDPAIQLYEKSGYTHIATKSRYYHNGEDGLIMQKSRG